MFRYIIALVALFLFSFSASADVDVGGGIKSGDMRTPDYGIKFVDMKPGYMVLHSWADDHKYFESIGMDRNSYCNAVMNLNPQFTWTDVRGCTNAGFTKLPAGEIIRLPSEFVAWTPDMLHLSSNETVVFAEYSGILGPVIMDRASAAEYLAEQSLRADADTFARTTSGILHDVFDLKVTALDESIEANVSESGQMSKEQPSQVSVASTEAETDQGGDVAVSATRPLSQERLFVPFITTFGASFLFIGFFIGYMIRRPKDTQTELAVALHQKKELEEDFVEETEALRGKIKGMERNLLPMKLPPDMRAPTSDNIIYLHVHDWSGIPHKSTAGVYLPGCDALVIAEFDEKGETFKFGRVLKHLNGDSESCRKTRLFYGVRRISDKVQPIQNAG